MRNEAAFNHKPGIMDRIVEYSTNFPRKTAVGLILLVALLAFETFNFDTTRYALRDLLGDVRFANIEWAAILAIAFCSIDFAGLSRIFTKEKGADEPKEVWYLIGAWLLGASMNAIMTWWAVSLTLLENEFGNEVMSREQLLSVVPVFVATLVWLTRILFIGSFTVAGEHFFEFSEASRPAALQRTRPYQEPVTAQLQPTQRQQTAPKQTAAPRPTTKVTPRRITPAPKPQPKPTAVAPTKDVPNFLGDYERDVVYEDIDYSPQTVSNRPVPSPAPQNTAPSRAEKPRPVAKRRPATPAQPRPSRIKQRPPMPNNGPRRQ